MIARRITDEDEPCPHGPFQEIDLDLATHLGVHERQVSRGPRRTLLAKFEGQLWQIRDKDNMGQLRKLQLIKNSRPRPLSRRHTRWTLSRYTREHELVISRKLTERYREMVPWTSPNTPVEWHLHLEKFGIKYGSMNHGAHEFALETSDPSQVLLYSIFLTEDQAEKIMVLGLP